METHMMTSIETGQKEWEDDLGGVEKKELFQFGTSELEVFE